ncbi:HP1 family phage holin [Orbus wheelerorum]|uniref:HP1 family phage holin n=1 Tax=Orbus wheelerorum TaxID=3074111 RepID=UPI00370D55DA
MGIILSVATFFINWAYKRRDFQNKKKLWKEYYAKYKKDNDDSALWCVGNYWYCPWRLFR